VLVVAHLDFDDTIRILSARKATRPERRAYERDQPYVRDPDMRDEYDFSSGVRGKYAKRYAAGSNVVVLDSDVAKVFPDSKSVNDALRAIADIAKKTGEEPAKDTPQSRLGPGVASSPAGVTNRRTSRHAAWQRVARRHEQQVRVTGWIAGTSRT
jgi:hypothetical protein